MSKSQSTASVHPNPDGSVAIQYVPKQSGAHDFTVNYNDIPVAGEYWQPTYGIALMTLTETICRCRYCSTAIYYFAAGLGVAEF